VPCSTTYTTADDLAEFFCRNEGYSAASFPTFDDVERYIEKAARRINLHLRATAQCSCTMSADATEYLQSLNLVGAALFIVCPKCNPRFTNDERRYWSDWLNAELTLLRSGELDLCDGATAVQYPHMTWAEQSVTEWNAARIVYNDILRDSS
jgi:hypothetical protein